MYSDSKQKILEWKPHFVRTIAHLAGKEELEQQFEKRVQELDEKQLSQALQYHSLWLDGQTASEKNYFAKKIAFLLLEGNPEQKRI